MNYYLEQPLYSFIIIVEASLGIAFIDKRTIQAAVLQQVLSLRRFCCYAFIDPGIPVLNVFVRFID